MEHPLSQELGLIYSWAPPAFRESPGSPRPPSPSWAGLELPITH